MKILRRLFLLTVILLIPWLSHKPSLKPPFQLFPHQDKALHFLEFAGLGVALHLNRDLWPRKAFLCNSLFGAGWAVLDEVHQHFVPGRTFDVWDILADVAGVLTALTLLHYASVHGKPRRALTGADRSPLDS